MSIRNLTILVVVSSCLLLASCGRRTVYASFCSVPLTGWEADSVLSFDYEIRDTTLRYDILLQVRHTRAYPYQNMWLFVENGAAQRCDTLEFYLADDRGQWLGDGYSTIEMPILYRQGFRYDSVGHYNIRIIQGMRQTPLRGIQDIGVEVIGYGQE